MTSTDLDAGKVGLPEEIKMRSVSSNKGSDAGLVAGAWGCASLSPGPIFTRTEARS